MTVEFIDLEWDANPRNASKIGAREELLALLNELHSLDPFFFELRGENGYTLTIGLGENVSAVQFSASDGGSPCLMVVAPGSAERLPDGDTNPYSAAVEADVQAGIVAPEFMCGGTATPVPTRYCVPYEVMKIVAVHFMETGARNPDVVWEEI
jgi:hypothetical protein